MNQKEPIIKAVTTILDQDHGKGFSQFAKNLQREHEKIRSQQQQLLSEGEIKKEATLIAKNIVVSSVSHLFEILYLKHKESFRYGINFEQTPTQALIFFQGIRGCLAKKGIHTYRNGKDSVPPLLEITKANLEAVKQTVDFLAKDKKTTYVILASTYKPLFETKHGNKEFVCNNLNEPRMALVWS
jgi:hypothetical protein